MNEPMPPEEAKEIYRNAWMQWCLCQDPAEKGQFESLMDSVQSSITPRPGPVWDAFRKTLPGYEEHWAGLKVEALAKIKTAFGKEAFDEATKNRGENS